MKLKKNKYNILVEIVCMILLIGVLIYLFINWNSIPDKIPGHYNAMGEIDRIGSKKELLVLPIISWLMYLGMTVLEQFPQFWNTSVTVTEENKERISSPKKYVKHNEVNRGSRFCVLNNKFFTDNIIISLVSSCIYNFDVWFNHIFYYKIS